jgi:SAM-dependent methyltransferase
MGDTPNTGIDPADHRRINQANWDSRVPHHVAGYGLDPFRTDPDHLSEVVRFDLPRLGSVDGLRGVHLQCHLGTDTLSLARLGATMSGLDFSGAAIDEARALAAVAGHDVHYVESDVYDAVEAFAGEQFDFVYTGIGALCWLPSVDRWATVVAGLLRPGGFLFIREGHPMMWALGDARDDDVLTIDFPYFETQGEVFVEEHTYVEHDEPLASPAMVHFNHGLGEIFNALWSAGLTITLFEEHRSVPWKPLARGFVGDESGEWRLAERTERLPLSYTLRAEKR